MIFYFLIIITIGHGGNEIPHLLCGLESITISLHLVIQKVLEYFGFSSALVDIIQIDVKEHAHRAVDDLVCPFYVFIGIDAAIIELLELQEVMGAFLIKGNPILPITIYYHTLDEGLYDLAVCIAQKLGNILEFSV